MPFLKACTAPIAANATVITAATNVTIVTFAPAVKIYALHTNFVYPVPLTKVFTALTVMLAARTKQFVKVVVRFAARVLTKCVTTAICVTSVSRFVPTVVLAQIVPTFVKTAANIVRIVPAFVTTADFVLCAVRI